MVPDPKYYSILAEISESKYRRVDQATLVEQTLEGYRKAQILTSSGRVHSIWKDRKEYGYPVPYVDRDRDVHTADTQLQKLGIWSRGRFGGWKYEVGNQDHVCMQGIEAVDQMVLGLKELEWFDPDLINSMYRPYPSHNLVPARYQKLKSMDIVVARCQEDLQWIEILVKEGIPDDIKFTIYVYEQCHSESKPRATAGQIMWDAVHHIQRYTISSPKGMEHAIVHHLSKTKLVDATSLIAFLDADQSGTKYVKPTLLRQMVTTQAKGFQFLAGDSTSYPGTNLCKGYTALLASHCPTMFKSHKSSQFMITRKRLFLVPKTVWVAAKQLLFNNHHTGSSTMQGLWHVIFGEPPIMGETIEAGTMPISD